jgi:hypothetical protein
MSVLNMSESHADAARLEQQKPSPSNPTPPSRIVHKFQKQDSIPGTASRPLSNKISRREGNRKDESALNSSARWVLDNQTGTSITKNSLPSLVQVVSLEATPPEK